MGTFGALELATEKEAPVVALGEQSLTKTELSPRVSVTYKLTPATDVYGAYARGFQPADLVDQNLAISSIRAETTNSYELGVRSSLPHGIRSMRRCI
jgi:outer membrane receptor protein involved in Fe transport